MNSIQSIVIAGGTHGNERTGIHLVQKLEKHPEIFQSVCPGISVQTIIANPSAARLCRRYDCQDLNRSFADFVLNTKTESNQDSLCYEINRAKKLNQQFGPKGTCTKTDLLIDVHNTTSNMGYCLILSTRDPFCMKASAILTQEFPNTFIYYQPEERGTSPYLGTIAKADICLEVGPQCHGTLNADLFEQTERIVLRYLELAAAWNKDPSTLNREISVEVFTQYKDIDYPRSANGKIDAMIHENLLGKDFSALKDGDPLFKTFDGQTIFYKGQTVYPIFINEAAYYEKKIAMSLTVKSEEIW